MLSGDPHCFGHPTKVTFTFSEKCLKNENPNYPPYASYWSASPYRENSAYNIQTWLAHKMKTQRQKLKLEKAVQRAEKKLQIEYDKQMELKRKAADQKFKIWLKSKGFANQSPVMLYRGPHHCPPDTTPSSSTPASGLDSKRPKTARVRSLETPNAASNQKTKGKLRPRSASASGNRKQITSTLDTKAAKPKPTCKALGQDDYMKMRHLAGKRYKKLKDEKSGFQCEDQILRKLQDLDWEEKCIKNKMVFSEKEDLGKVKAKALKKGKKKLKFKGDVITVEVEEMDSNADVDITFEEVDDKCSDIGCIEKEGVDFHIESRETIDLSDKPDEEFCRPMTAEPPRIECEVAPPSAPARPKSSKPRPVDKEIVTKKEVAKEASVDSKKSAANEKKQAKEEACQTQEVNTSVKGTKKEGKAAAAPPKVVVSPPKENSSPPKEKASPKTATSPPKEAASPAPDKASPKKAASPPKKDASPALEVEKAAQSQEQAKPPKESPAKPKEVTSSPKEVTPPQKEAAQPPAEKVSQKENVKSTKDSAKAPAEKVSPSKEVGKQPTEKVSPPKKAEKVQTEKVSPPKKAEKLPTEKVSPPKKAEKLPTEKVSPPKKAEKLPSEKELPVKETEKSPKETAKPTSEKAPSSKDTVESSVIKITPNGEVREDKSSTKVAPVIDTAVADSKIASDSFFD